MYDTILLPYLVTTSGHMTTGTAVKTECFAKLIARAWTPLVTPTTKWVFLAVAGEPVAVGGFDFDRTPLPWMGPTFVLEEFRGREYQRILIRERLEIARKWPKIIQTVETAIDLNNHGSLRNTLREGFTIHHYDEAEDHFVLRRSVHP